MRKQFFMFLLVLCGVIIQTNAQNVNANSTTGGNGSYATLKGAFDDINSGLLSGVVTITVVNNTNETDSAVIYASGTGSANYTSVSISPSGGMWTVTGNIAGGPLVRFDGADNVMIDGINANGDGLTFSNTSTAGTVGTSTIRFMNDATNNTITNCTILGSATSTAATASGTILFNTTNVSTGATGNDNNAITYCNIGPAGSSLPTKAIHSLGTGTASTPATYNSGITIDNCNISDYFLASGTAAGGIWLGNGNGNWTISNNKFYQTGLRTQTTGSVHAAVYVTGAIGNSGHSIINNTIGFANATGTGMYRVVGTTSTQVIGIYFANTVSGATCSVQGNTISNIAVSGTVSGNGSSGPFIGISIATSNVVASIGNVTPNTIGSQTTTGAITVTGSNNIAGESVGIFAGGAANSNISNNFIGGMLVSNTSSGAAILTGIRTGNTTGIALSITGNTIGGTVANSMQSTTASIGSQVMGMFLNGPATTVTGNTIRNMTAAGGTGSGSGASVSGIVVLAAASNHTVSQNTIYALSNTAASGATIINGIFYSSGTGANAVSRNFIHSFSTASNTAIQHGIYIQQGATTYSNNMIRLGIDAAGADVTTGTTINGMYENSGTNSLYYNSISIGGTGVDGSLNSYAFQSVVATGARNYINNAFVNARSNGLGTGKHYAIKIGGTAPTPSGLTMNNNLMYVSGTGGVFGYYNSADVADLAAWTTAVGLNAGSVSSDPLFTMPNGTAATVDLAPVMGSPLMGNATPIAAVTTDYLGTTRSTFNPTIGAGETTASLPVKWISFTGQKQSNGVGLTWATASELNNSHYVVQRSEDGKTFTDIAKVKGKGTTSRVSSYGYFDGYTPTGASTVYYRLLQVDNDRKVHTSSVVVVSAGEKVSGEMQVSPNPFIDVTTVSVNADQPATAVLKIVDIQGRTVVEKTIELQSGMNRFSVDEMSGDAYSGIYFVTVSTATVTYTQRIVKAK